MSDELAAARQRREVPEPPIEFGEALVLALEQFVTKALATSLTDALNDTFGLIVALARHHRAEFYHPTTLHLSTPFTVEQLAAEWTPATAGEPALTLRDALIESFAGHMAEIQP
jgi:hypothetical protein